VTHDQEEALMLSDRIALMQGGRLIESGTPRSLYLEPTTVFGATFLGAAEVIAVTARHGNRVDTAIGALQLERVLPDLTHVAIRPEAIVIEPAAGASPTNDGINRMPATLTSVVFSGRHQQLVLELPGGRRLNAQVDATRPFTAGDAVVVALPPSRLMPLLEDSAA
ncbi:MAG: TOBE domain-containing protein, partial [Rhodoferax sp.]|nr:TOBE domain-containing protein [Rhodoferax sp.]